MLPQLLVLGLLQRENPYNGSRVAGGFRECLGGGGARARIFCSLPAVLRKQRFFASQSSPESSPQTAERPFPKFSRSTPQKNYPKSFPRSARLVKSLTHAPPPPNAHPDLLGGRVNQQVRPRTEKFCWQGVPPSEEQFSRAPFERVSRKFEVSVKKASRKPFLLLFEGKV